MATLDTKIAYKNLCKKGFQDSETNSVDHKYIEFWYEGKITRIRTKFSHGKKEIDSSLIGLMCKQIKLSKNEFLDFAKCNISEEGYIEILKKNKII